jgi:hypothetical protein
VKLPNTPETDSLMKKNMRSRNSGATSGPNVATIAGHSGSQCCRRRTTESRWQTPRRLRRPRRCSSARRETTRPELWAKSISAAPPKQLASPPAIPVWLVQSVLPPLARSAQSATHSSTFPTMSNTPQFDWHSPRDPVFTASLPPMLEVDVVVTRPGDCSGDDPRRDERARVAWTEAGRATKTRSPDKRPDRVNV